MPLWKKSAGLWLWLNSWGSFSISSPFPPESRYFVKGVLINNAVGPWGWAEACLIRKKRNCFHPAGLIHCWGFGCVFWYLLRSLKVNSSWVSLSRQHTFSWKNLMISWQNWNQGRVGQTPKRSTHGARTIFSTCRGIHEYMGFICTHLSTVGQFCNHLIHRWTDAYQVFYTYTVVSILKNTSRCFQKNTNVLGKDIHIAFILLFTYIFLKVGFFLHISQNKVVMKHRSNPALSAPVIVHDGWKLLRMCIVG